MDGPDRRWLWAALAAAVVVIVALRLFGLYSPDTEPVLDPAEVNLPD